MSWRSRVLTALMFYVVMRTHEFATSDLPNSPIGMLVFHGSAGLFDFLLLYALPSMLTDRLCDDMQTLCLVSIIVNFIGFLAYMAYAPPNFYNLVSWGLTYVQFARLLIMDGHDVNSLGMHLVRRPGLGRA